MHRIVGRCVIALVALASTLVIVNTAEAAPTVITGSIAAGDTDQTGRILRDGRVSGCGTAKPAPAIPSAAPISAADDHTLTNTGAAPACITVEMLMSGCGANSTGVVAYLGSYNAANPVTNYLGDSGFS